MNARPRIHTNDIVAPAGHQFPKGAVVTELPGNFIVVRWPSGLYSKHKPQELRRIA